MPKRDKLLALERGFWTGDAQYFRENADSSCLVAFPDMAGVLGNKDLSETAQNPHRWKDLELDLKGILVPEEGFALLTYEASAKRENGEPYAALVSSGYVKREDGWKLVFHSHAPKAAV